MTSNDEQSAETSLAFVTFRVNAQGLGDASGTPLPNSLEGLPPMALVLAAGEIDLEAQPDEGVQAESARELDALEDTSGTSTKSRLEED